MTSVPFRLPRHARPLAYEVHLRAAPGLERFQGEARIAVELSKGSDEVVLNARDLAFRSAQAEQAGKRVEARMEPDPSTESVRLRLPRPLAAGKATLHLAWDAPVSKSMMGLYLSKDGPEECLVTHCEATDARAIFPCFDEPEFKATLRWRITAPKGMVVLANGAETGRKDEPDGWVTIDFAPTPPMSSYLAALAIGKFGSTAEQRVGGVPFKVWAMEGKEGLGTRAREAAATLLPWYEGYFGVPYHFGKYDQVAVPSFSFGAMENAGLVVFRASLLLMDPRTAGWRDERDIVLVVAHEFAHQWFGNLVTMRWWDDLWLNESFAEWIAHKAVEASWPQHEPWIDMQARTNRAMATDALGATHPIYQPVQTPAEAAELFDAITYGKGSAVMRMLEGFLGEGPFRDGLRAYMQEFAERNAAGADLWRHLAAASAQPVERIMQSWVGQPGHPAVRASLDGATLRLRQQRFRSMPGADPGAQTWDVPLVVRYEDDAGTHTHPFLLREREGALALPARGKVRWALLNAGDVGFYRSDPDAAMLKGLAAHAAKLRPEERVALLRDQWSLVRSGARPPQGCMVLLASLLPAERHYAVADVAAGVLRDAERLLEGLGDEAALQGLRGFASRAARPVLDAAGLDPRPGEAPSLGLLRASAYHIVGGVGRDAATLQHATSLADRERADAAAVDPNLAPTAVGLAAMLGDAKRYDAHLQAYEHRRDARRPPQEVDRYLLSFPGFRAAPLVERTLGLLERLVVPKQSVGPLLARMLAEPHSQGAAWGYLVQHWDGLHKELGDSWMAILAESAGRMPAARRQEAEEFLAKKAARYVQSVARARDLLAERAAVEQRVLPALAKWARGA